MPIALPDDVPARKGRPAVEIDVGLNRLATFQRGKGYKNQAFLEKGARKTASARTSVCIVVLKGSKNREKAHRPGSPFFITRITCPRDDVLHKLTTRLADGYGIVGIEDLNLKGLLRIGV